MTTDKEIINPRLDSNTEKEITYKNCNHCEWMGELVSSWPDRLRCPNCLTPWNATEKYQKPKPGFFKQIKSRFE